MKKYTFFSALIALFFSLTSSLSSQNIEHWFHNINEDFVVLDGYDVVAYLEEEKAIKGSPDYIIEFEGITYQFASRKNSDLFHANPEKYFPAYGGWCTFLMGIDPASFPPTRSKPDPENFKIIDGQLHLFGKRPQQDFKQVFESVDQKEHLKRANEFWQSRQELATKADGLPDGLNPRARMELLDWAPFMGDWSTELTWWADTTGQTMLNFTGKWYFRYGYFGYCIQDDYVGDEDNNFSGTPYGPAIRGYDPVNQEWHMTYIPVNQTRDNTWLMRGNFLEDGIIEGRMTLTDPSGNPVLQKVRFEKQGPDKFIWRADWSYDEGKTWLEKVGYSICTRIR